MLFFTRLLLPYYIYDTVIVLLKISSGSTSAVVHQILSKSDNIFTEIWWFNDFQNGNRPPSWILKICSFCHLAFVGMPFSFLEQNFAEIRKSVELWPKKRFLRWRPPWIFKNFNFWSRDYSICYMYRILSKSDDFSLTHGDLTIFKMAAVRHLGFKIFADFLI